MAHSVVGIWCLIALNLLKVKGSGRAEHTLHSIFFMFCLCDFSFLDTDQSLKGFTTGDMLCIHLWKKVVVVFFFFQSQAIIKWRGQNGQQRLLCFSYAIQVHQKLQTLPVKKAKGITGPHCPISVTQLTWTHSIKAYREAVCTPIHNLTWPGEYLLECLTII